MTSGRRYYIRYMRLFALVGIACILLAAVLSGPAPIEWGYQIVAR